MKKIVMSLMLVLLLAGCGSKPTEWNMEELAGTLLEQGSYDTGFVLLEQDQAEGLLPGIEECSSEVMVYESDSEIMNEIILVRTEQPEKAEKVIEERKAYLVKESENYFPEQLQMIQEAILDIRDDCLIFVISSDPEQMEKLIAQIHD